MRLKELSERSGTNTATIKFYLREGLLQSGKRLNTTLADYGDSHVVRLQLIATLRTAIGARLDQIKALTDRIDDPAVEFLQILQDAQSLALGEAIAVDGETTRAEVAEAAEVENVIVERGWPDAPTRARAALNAHVAKMRELGVDIDQRTISVYAEAADRVAAHDIGTVHAATTRDEAVGVAAVGVHSYATLLLRLVALAQTSRSITAFGGS